METHPCWFGPSIFGTKSRPYFRRRSGSLEGIFVASSVGVVSGIYIFKPLLDEIAANQKARKEREALEAAATAGNGVEATNSTPNKK